MRCWGVTDDGHRPPPAASAEEPSGSPAPPPDAQRRSWTSHPFAWTSSTYFAEGFPYTLVNQLPEILFKDRGASLESIGLTALFHLPWNIKFLWGPFLDRFGTKRKWIVGLEVLLVAVSALLAVTLSGASVLVTASVLFVVMAFLSATHDMAIDGYYLEALDEAGQSRYVGTRSAAYRISMLAVSGGLVVLIGRFGWGVGFGVATAVLALLLGYHWTFLPRAEAERRPARDLLRLLVQPRSLAWAAAAAAGVLGGRALLGSAAFATWQETWPKVLRDFSAAQWIALTLLLALIGARLALPFVRRRLAGSTHFYAKAFVDFVDQPRVDLILAFVVLFRAGESFLLKMRFAFLRDIGITTEQYGVLSGTVGVIASFVGTILGGWLIARYGLRRWIWPLVLAQNVLNLLYAFLAWKYAALWASPGSGAASVLVVGAVIVVEAFGAGTGTAVFMVYLMRCCRPDFKAAHMAIVTALMSVGFTLAGVASGFLAEALGFTTYFGFSFVATLPAMLLIPFLPHLDRAPARPATPA